MKHSHNHSCQCAHTEVKYCNHCLTVYCLGCNQEWTAKVGYTYTYPWYSNRTLGPSFLGNTSIGPTQGIIQQPDTNTLTCKHGS